MQANNVEIAKALIAFDADVNFVSGLRKTPMDLASCHPHSELNGILKMMDGKTYMEKLYEEEGMNFHMELKQACVSPVSSPPVSPLGGMCELAEGQS